MTAILNEIRDAVLPDTVKQERSKDIACLEIAKLALRVGAAALAIITLAHPAILSLGLLLPVGYFFIEWSMIASNQQEIWENAGKEIAATLSDRAHERQLFKYAPLTHSIVRIGVYLDRGLSDRLN